jgi:hypothetical protein
MAATNQRVHAMPNHTVQPGDHLALIASDAGFRKVATVWDDGGNAELRQRREHPGVLEPGDTVFVPEVERKHVIRPTDDAHKFRVKRDRLWLRLVVRDFSHEPVANCEGTLEVAGQLVDIVTDGEGHIDQPVPLNAREGMLRLPKVGLELKLDIGMLDPVDTEAGWSARLANLGYFHGNADDADDGNERWDWALQEFQCDHGLTVTGEPDDATKAKLLELCGS